MAGARTGCPVHIDFQPVPLASGHHDGTRPAGNAVVLAAMQHIRVYADPFATPPAPNRFIQASWTSAQVEPGFAFTELVPSWHARTPGSTWVEIAARVRFVAGLREWSRWLILARWADNDTSLHPTSLPQPRRPAEDPPATVDVDTVRAPGGADAWQIRVTLLRGEHDDGDGPALTYLGVMVSAGTRTGIAPDHDPATAAIRVPAPRSGTGAAGGRVLDLAALSQRGYPRHPTWGGGDVWCSPVSVAMVLRFWNVSASPDALSWVDPRAHDPDVYHAVRHTWDYAYGSSGNWSFNAAYAARFGLATFVTRLRDLTEAEGFIAAGIPLIASLRVDPTRLAGADYSSAGHLVVIAGFTDGGDVVVHDPGARDPAAVRRVYRRGEFEVAWWAGSGGIVYVIHPPDVGLPDRPAEPNW